MLHYFHITQHIINTIIFRDIENIPPYFHFFKIFAQFVFFRYLHQAELTSIADAPQYGGHSLLISLPPAFILMGQKALESHAQGQSAGEHACAL